MRVKTNAFKPRQIAPCPYCSAQPIPHRSGYYKIIHKRKCYIAITIENNGWINPNNVDAWNERNGGLIMCVNLSI